MSRLTKKIENPQYSNDYEMICAHDYHVLNKLGKIEDLLENYDIQNLSGLNKKLTILQILCEHPTYSIADLENLVDDYDEGKINKDFDLYEYKFLYKYFGRNWGEPPYYPELDDEED